MRSLISITQLANSSGLLTRLQDSRALPAGIGVKSLILRTHRDKSSGLRASAQALAVTSLESWARKSSALQISNGLTSALAGVMGIVRASKLAVAS